MAIGLALATSVAIAASVAEVDGGGVIVPSATSLMRFYPTQLSSTPSGIVEDQEVWLAKVQGLMAAAPSLLQQSLLMSQTKQEFSANVTLLQQLQKGALEQRTLDLRSQAKAGMMTKSLGGTNNLGDPNNLVYTALEPCRIMDTRNASGASGVQGPIIGGVLKHIPGFITTGTNWSQYGQTGTLSDCGLNSSVGSNIYAVAIVITILNPNFDAFLGVGDINNLATTLSTVALNYTHGQGLSTSYIVPQVSGNTIYFALPGGLSANLIFDVVGYFDLSDATALDCVNTAGTTLPIAAGGNAQPFAPGCAAGYTFVSTTCFADAYVVNLAATVGCAYHNWDSVAHNVTASATCCRVPGK
jgi:hypothetical protein